MKSCSRGRARRKIAPPEPRPGSPGSRVLARLFAPPPADDTGAARAAVLARAATLASGRAMKGRLWNEAKALAALAESYARLAERARRGGDDDPDRQEPDEAAFEAVRRKVLGMGDEPPLSWFGLEARGGAQDGDGRSGGPAIPGPTGSPTASGTAPPRP